MRFRPSNRIRKNLSRSGRRRGRNVVVEQKENKDTHRKGKDYLNFKINAKNKLQNDIRNGSYGNSKIVAYTSISPKHAHSENQIEALESWHKLGIEIYSLNCKEEIGPLKIKYPDWVNFVETRKTTIGIFGKPCVMINEMMDHFYNNETGDILMLINSDIIINTKEETLDKIKSISEICVPIAHRGDYVETVAENKKYEFGFDVFFIHRKHIKIFPQSIYSMGQTWWDYWIPYVAIKNDVTVISIKQPFAFHKEHPIQYNVGDWIKMTNYFKWENGINISDTQECTNKILEHINKKSISYSL